MKTIGWSVLLAGLVVGLDVVAQNPEGMPDMTELSQAMQAMFSTGTNAAPVVDFRELKALLPQEISGIKRTSASGEKNSAMGMNVAEAQGMYETDDGSLTIKITDMGGMGQFMMMAQAGWASAEIDRESDDGYEKTTTVAGYKAIEEYSSNTKQGTIKILVGQRFMVEILGDNMDMEPVKAAAAAIDLKKLETIKPK